jgi:3-methyladenine DNA glycosylase AlkD
MRTGDARVREAQARLDGLARPASGHPASGGYGSRLRRLGLRTAEVRAVARELARQCRTLPPRAVVAVGLGLVRRGTLEGGLVACELLSRHRAASASLTARDLERLARDPDNWVTTDSFACLLSGPAWHGGRIGDEVVERWARSPNRWWRRIALVSTVPLNLPSRGGTGDVPRTLRLCGRLVADRDDMVVKAMSWALREAAKRDPLAVRRFLARHGRALAPRVVREVTNKLATGLKDPGRSRRGIRRAAGAVAVRASLRGRAGAGARP